MSEKNTPENSSVHKPDLTPRHRDDARVTMCAIGHLTGDREMWATAVGTAMAEGIDAVLRMLSSATSAIAGTVLDGVDEDDPDEARRIAVADLRELLANQQLAADEEPQS